MKDIKMAIDKIATPTLSPDTEEMIRLKALIDLAHASLDQLFTPIVTEAQREALDKMFCDYSTEVFGIISNCIQCTLLETDYRTL